MSTIKVDTSKQYKIEIAQDIIKLGRSKYHQTYDVNKLVTKQPKEKNAKRKRENKLVKSATQQNKLFDFDAMRDIPIRLVDKSNTKIIENKISLVCTIEINSQQTYSTKPVQPDIHGLYWFMVCFLYTKILFP